MIKLTASTFRSRQPVLPYSIVTRQDGSLLLLHRRYKPLGSRPFSRTKFNYDALPAAVTLPPDGTEPAAQRWLWSDGSSVADVQRAVNELLEQYAGEPAMFYTRHLWKFEEVTLHRLAVVALRLALVSDTEGGIWRCAGWDAPVKFAPVTEMGGYTLRVSHDGGETERWVYVYFGEMNRPLLFEEKGLRLRFAARRGEDGKWALIAHRGGKCAIRHSSNPRAFKRIVADMSELEQTWHIAFADDRVNPFGGAEG